MSSSVSQASSDITELWYNVTSSLRSGDNLTVQAPEGCVVLTQQSDEFIPWDNPDNLVSRSVERAIDTAVGVVFLPLFLVISIPANVINMAVFWTQGLKERVNLCLFSLSMADVVYMVFSFLFNFERIGQLITGSKEFGPVFAFIIDNYLVGFRGVNWVSGYISMLIACERCFCVVSPLRSQSVLKTRTMGLMLLMGTLFLMAFVFVGTTRWSLACLFDPLTNTKSTTLYISDFYAENKALLDVLSGLVLSFVIPTFYVTVVTSTTIVTSMKLTRIVAWREQTSSATVSSREVNLTRMLIGVSVLYVMCTLPVVTLGVCISFIPDMSLQGRYYNTFNLLVSLFELFSYINASVNLFVYLFLGSRYRDTLRQLMPCARKPPDPMTAKQGAKVKDTCTTES